MAVLSTEDITIFTYQDLKLGQVIKDQELQKLILRALKWNEPGKTIAQQLDRLKNASFRGVLNNPDLLRDEDLVQLLGPYLDHGSFAPLDTSRSTTVEFSTKTMMDQNVTEMEVGVDPELFFPYDDDESKGMDVEVTKVTKMIKVTKPKKERKKAESRHRTPNKKTSMANSSSSTVSTIIAPISPPAKIRIKAEGLFKPFASHSKHSVPIPKPIIVVPPKVVQNNTNVVPAAVKLKIIDEVSSVQIIPEPKIVTPTKSAIVAKTNNVSTSTIIERPIIVQSPTSSQSPSQTKPQIKLTSHVSTTQPEPEKKSLKSEENASNALEKLETKISSKNVYPKPDTTTTTTIITNNKIVTTSATTTTSRTPPKVTAPKVESKTRTTRKVKIDQSGPKTRARSIFNNRHKCGVCGKKFATSGNLKAHVKTHKPKGKFNCDKCGRV